MSGNRFFGMLPPAATEIARSHDSLFMFITWLSVFFFVLVVGAMVLFLIKYSKKNNPVPTNIHENVPLEITWTVVPTIILAVVFGWGFVVYKDMMAAPGNAYEIHVIGKQWLWQFQYDNGKSTIGDLYVPAGRPVKLIMTSEDVLHSLYIPDFRIKKDTVPGMYSYLWFKAEVPGEHVIYCAEYCGTTHSGMLGKVIALENSKFEDWLSGKGSADTAMANLPLDQQGKDLFTKKGCNACHSTDGSVLVGPSMKGLFGKTETLADDTTVTVDETYLRESILEPQAKLVKGFNPLMPTFKSLINDQEINAVIAYIQSLK